MPTRDRVIRFLLVTDAAGTQLPFIESYPLDKAAEAYARMTLKTPGESVRSTDRLTYFGNQGGSHEHQRRPW
jgi:hypothetical protein